MNVTAGERIAASIVSFLALAIAVAYVMDRIGLTIAPFVVLAVGYGVSRRWPVLTRATVYGVTPVITVASLAIYGTVAFGAPRPKTAVFVVVAPASWLLMAVVVATAVLISRQSSFRGK